MLLVGAAARLTNSTFASNTALLGQGGALWMARSSGTAQLDGCTFVGNSALVRGGCLAGCMAGWLGAWLVDWLTG